MLEPPRKFYLRELRGQLAGGRTGPWLAVAVDDDSVEHQVVVKLRYPGPPVGEGHYGPTSLACELICSVLARYLGLSVPDYAILVVEHHFVQLMPRSSARDLFAANIGDNFCTRYHASLSLWNPSTVTSSRELLERLEDLITFDATVINGDRKTEKPNLLYRGSEVLLIDHSLAIPAHLWRWEVVNSSPLLPETEVNEHCAAGTLRKKGFLYGRLFENWSPNNNDSLVDEIIGLIPPVWERQEGDLEKLSAFLNTRPARFGAISTALARTLQ